MSVNNYCLYLYRALEVQLADVTNNLLAGSAQTLEHYKYLIGRKEGLEIAINTAKAAYKKMYEELPKNKDVAHDDRSIREMY